jgi:hypothetical protein
MGEWPEEPQEAPSKWHTIGVNSPYFVARGPEFGLPAVTHISGVALGHLTEPVSSL